MTGVELKTWCEERGVEPRDLAKMLNGLPYRTLENWIYEHRNPPVFLELALCEVARRYKLKVGRVATEQYAAPDRLRATPYGGG